MNVASEATRQTILAISGQINRLDRSQAMWIFKYNSSSTAKTQVIYSYKFAWIVQSLTWSIQQLMLEEREEHEDKDLLREVLDDLPGTWRRHTWLRSTANIWNNTFKVSNSLSTWHAWTDSPSTSQSLPRCWVRLPDICLRGGSQVLADTALFAQEAQLGAGMKKFRI